MNANIFLRSMERYSRQSVILICSSYPENITIPFYFNFETYARELFSVVYNFTQGHIKYRYSQETPSMGQHSLSWTHGCIL